MISSFRRSSLSPSWTLETRTHNEIIWRLLISPSGVLVGEERDIEAKTASLFAIDLLAGKTLWRHVTLDEPWWFASEKATEETLFLQTYRKPDLPEPKGIIAIDLKTGNVRWQQHEFSLFRIDRDKVFATRLGFSRRDYLSLDPRTGGIVEELGDTAPALKQLNVSSTEPDTNTLNSNPLRSNDPACEMFYAVVDPTDIRGPVEYLEFKDYNMYCYHARVRGGADAMLQNMLTNELVVLGRKSGKVIFRETLHRETPFPLPDNFFVTHDTLIYVKEKRELVGVKLL